MTITFLIVTACSIEASQGLDTTTATPTVNALTEMGNPPAYKEHPPYIPTNHEGYASSWTVTSPINQQRDHSQLPSIYHALNIQSARISYLETQLREQEKKHSEQISHLGGELAMIYALLNKQTQSKS